MEIGMYEMEMYLLILHWSVSFGELGTVPKDLPENIRQLDFNKKESNDIIKAIQQRAIIGTVKICKTFMNFKK